MEVYVVIIDDNPTTGTGEYNKALSEGLHSFVFLSFKKALKKAAIANKQSELLSKLEKAVSTDDIKEIDDLLQWGYGVYLQKQKLGSDDYPFECRGNDTYSP